MDNLWSYLSSMKAGESEFLLFLITERERERQREIRAIPIGARAPKKYKKFKGVDGLDQRQKQKVQNLKCRLFYLSTLPLLLFSSISKSELFLFSSSVHLKLI